MSGCWRDPVLLAVAFGVVSVPLVAISLLQPLADWKQEIVNAPPIGWLDALVLALVSVVVASIAGGSLGRTLVRTRPVPAVLVAIGTAWPIGIGMLSITAAVFGIPLRTGVLCIDTCTPSVTGEEALSGFAAYATSLEGAAVFVVPVIVAVVLVVGGVLLARRGRSVAAIVLAVVGYGALHLWTILLGGAIPFACLAIGVMVWAIALHETTSEPLVAEPALEATVDGAVN